MIDMPEMNSQSVLTAREVCLYLKIPLSTLYGLSKRGRIKGVKVGKHWRYKADDIHSFLSHSGTQGETNGNGMSHGCSRPVLLVNSGESAFRHLGVGDSVHIVFKIQENGNVRSFEMEGIVMERKSDGSPKAGERGAS